MLENRLTFDECKNYSKSIYPDSVLCQVALAANLFFYSGLKVVEIAEDSLIPELHVRSGQITAETLRESVGDEMAESALFDGYGWVDTRMNSEDTKAL